MKNIKILDKSNLIIFANFFNICINRYKDDKVKSFDICEFNINDLIRIFPSFIEKYIETKNLLFQVGFSLIEVVEKEGSKPDRYFLKYKKYWEKLKKWESKATDEIKLLLELGLG